MTTFTLHHGDCLDVLATLPENSIDAVVTDPPYDLVSINKRFGKEGSAPAQYGTDGAFGRLSKGFMGKAWDGTGIAFRADLWAAVLRVLKPGGHLIATGGDRTIHRMICAIEDAGFEIRNQLVWLHGQGFPKNMDISKQIDRMAGAEREVVRARSYELRNEGGYSGGLNTTKPRSESCEITAPATPAAQQWQGWGTALKPGMELVCLARKPLSESTVAANVLRWGTGALNIDAGRIASGGQEQHRTAGSGTLGQHGIYGGANEVLNSKQVARAENGTNPRYDPQGRWPANVLLDDQAAELLDQQSGERYNPPRRINNIAHGQGATYFQTKAHGQEYADTGGASRFFYTAKASRSERSKGLEERDAVPVNDGRQTSIDNPYQRGDTPRQNIHPTVKPLSLMRYLIRLITPPGGVVLDPFMGSGSTGVAALDCGFAFVGIEREAEYLAIADARIAAAQVLPLPLETLL